MTEQFNDEKKHSIKIEEQFDTYKMKMGDQEEQFKET